MIKSMTGYGKSTLSINSREYQVEIKTVNHKYLDTSIRMPRCLSSLEEDVRKEIASNLKRGKVEVSINFENHGKNINNIVINTELAKDYIRSLKKLADEEGLEANIEVTEITKLPDVLTIKEDLDNDEIKKELLQVVQDTVNQLIEMRKKEGQKISVAILEKIDKEIEKLNYKMNNLVDMKLEETITNDQFEAKRIKIAKSLEKKQKQRAEIEDEIQNEEAINLRLEKFKNIFANRTILEEFDREVFECLIEKIIIGEEKEDGTYDPYTIKFICRGDSNSQSMFLSSNQGNSSMSLSDQPAMWSV